MADPLATAIAEGARRALTRRAASLRQEAHKLVTIEDHGRPVPIVPPEARVMMRTADLFDEAAEAIAPTRD